MKNLLKKYGNKKIIIAFVIVMLFLASIGITYAYFSAGLAEQNPNDEIVTTGTLRLTL